MRKKFRLSLSSKTLLLVLSLLCVGMLFLTFTTNSSLRPLKTATSKIVMPLQNGINKIGGWFSGKTDYFSSLDDVIKQNKELQSQVDTLTTENSMLKKDTDELKELRELYELSETYSNYDTVAANITGKDIGNWFNSFVINKGSNDGIALDMNVIANGGLVGIVSEVDNDWSRVRAIIDDESNVGAMVSDTSDLCYVTGDLQLINDGKVRIIQLADTDDKVKAGDEVVTSHVSSKFLPGILIGYVTELSKDSNNLTKSGYISPVVDFKHLKTVLIITELKE